MAKKTTWRSFTIPLEKTVTPQEYSKIETLLHDLTIELQAQLNDPRIPQVMSLKSLKSSGHYRDDYTKIMGKPYSYWNSIQGNKAKYQRMIIERLRVIFLSLHDKYSISQICQKYCYDFSKINEIIADLKAINIYPKLGYLKNICQSQNYPTLPSNIDAYLDFTTGDKQIIMQNIVNGSIMGKIHINGEWINYSFNLPSHLRPYKQHFSKPIIQFDNTNNLIMRFAYEVDIVKSNSNNNYCLSVDLGKVKPFTASINYDDGSYSTELTMSKELEQLSNKHKLYNKELLNVYSKINRISKLLANNDDSYLLKHYKDLRDYAVSIKLKRTLLKKHISWCIARDIVSHAVYHKTKIIKLEDLSWLGSLGGKWDHALTQQKIIEIAELHGISVVTVDARDSSHTDPFTNNYVNPNSVRVVKTENGFLDRDYCASLELGRRVKKSKKHRKNAVKGKFLKVGACRDKHGPTPKRPKKKIVKKSMNNVYKVSGVSIAVASSGETRLKKTISRSLTQEHTKHDYYTLVLQS